MANLCNLDCPHLTLGTVVRPDPVQLNHSITFHVGFLLKPTSVFDFYQPLPL